MEDNELKEMFYKESLHIMGKEQDWKVLCATLAAADPEAFCKALNITPWQLQAKRIYATESKIDAIKYVRNEKGFSLRDSKLAVEELCEE